MQLKLRYTGPGRHRMRAALIRGSDPVFWLSEISRWGIPAGELELYVMPESLSSVAAGGLFVCFGGNVPETDQVLQPYRLEGDGLYLPLNAELYPEMTATELRAAFLWERQVFHPVVGMVGFEARDRLNPAALIDFPVAAGRDWGRAHEGTPPVPPLERIGMDRPPMEDFFRETGVADQSPDEIPGAEKDPSEGQKMMRDFQKGALKGVKGFLDALNDAFAGKGSGSGRSGGGGAEGPGMFDRLQGWVNKRLDDLEEKRKKELDRLMDLFERDPDQALRFAIPLGGNYWQRGIGTPSDRLGARDTNFNLGGLGGGGPVDGWHVQGYESKLRQAYIEAAGREIEAGNFRKAAYIHAHLLGDFQAAANVLEQGKYYREAAVLYKDHLKNVSAAAECLERGGLLLDAVELYLELGRREKAADLYVTLKRRDKADILYQACVDEAISRKLYTDAGRLYLEKMDRPEKAMDTYLEGWKAMHENGVCLNRFLDLYEQHGKKSLAARMEDLYRDETQPAQQEIFFRSLTVRRIREQDEESRERMDELGMQIISEHAQNGQYHPLHSIRTFTADDRLVSADANRFIQNRSKLPRKPAGARSFRLPGEVRWVQAVGLPDGLLATGIGAGNEIWLVRSNWEGKWVLCKIQGTIADQRDRLMVNEENNCVYLLPYREQRVPVQDLTAGSLFRKDLRVMVPHGYSGRILAVGAGLNQGTYMLESSEERRSLIHAYSGTGDLQHSELTAWLGGQPFWFRYPHVADQRLWYCRSGRFRGHFMLVGRFLLFRDELRKGMKALDLQEGVLGSSDLNSKEPYFPPIDSPEPGLQGVLERYSEFTGTMALSPYSRNVRIALSFDGGVVVVDENDLQTWRVDPGKYLADIEFQCDLLSFLPNDFLAISGESILQIYDLRGSHPEFICYFSLEQPAIAIMPTDFRCQVAAVLENGAVKVFEFDRY